MAAGNPPGSSPAARPEEPGSASGDDARVMEKVRIEYPHLDPLAVRAALDAYGVEPHERERRRVQLAVLRASGGDFARLEELVQLAKIDYRDVLVMAEYPGQMAFPPGTEEAGALDRARREDARAYRAWLDRGKR